MLNCRRSLFFTVAATSHEERGTELQIWFNGQRYPLWSNFSWEVMQGFPVFEDDKHRFTFLLFLSYGKKGDWDKATQKLPDFPNLKVDGPRFTARKDTPEEVLDFVDAAHRLYLHGGKRLKEANRKRKDNRKRARKREGADPVTLPAKIEVTFWRNEKKLKQEGGLK